MYLLEERELDLKTWVMEGSFVHSPYLHNIWKIEIGAKTASPPPFFLLLDS